MNVTPTGIAVAIAVVIALSFLFFGADLLALFSPQTEEMPVAEQTDTLMVTDTVAGTGAEAAVGSKITVNYVGMFENGEVFDASANHGGTFTFVLGVDSVIQGWQQGLVGMKEGGTRHLVIPPELGYGPNDYGPIPGNSTLIFDVELIKVEAAQ